MISYVIPVAYDYAYAYDAIRSIYSIADEIVIGVDRERLTWSKQPFAFDAGQFSAHVRALDPRGIIRVIEDDFHSEDHPMKNDTRERNLLTRHCREGNWIVQLDSDERALNAKDLRRFLGTLDPECDATADFITVFKVIGNQCLVTSRPWERCPVATRLRGGYQTCRTTGRKLVHSPLKIFHFSWGRTREELVQKVTNWGHAHDFDTGRFLELWDRVNLTNYQSIRNFHPLYGPLWPGLTAVDLPKLS